MGFIRRRTRRRTMLVAGGAAYAAGRATRGRDEPADEAQQAAPESGGESEVDELQRLSDMHDSGALTDEEFDAEKAKLLGN